MIYLAVAQGYVICGAEDDYGHKCILNEHVLGNHVCRCRESMNTEPSFAEQMSLLFTVCNAPPLKEVGYARIRPSPLFERHYYFRQTMDTNSLRWLTVY